MARSNMVIRNEFIDGATHVVLACSTGHEFHRLGSIRGVRPFECPEHTTHVTLPRSHTLPRLPEEMGTEEKGTPKHHKSWPLFIAFLKSGTATVPIQPYLCGEAGTGKTFSAGLAAVELGLPFRAESCSIGGTEVDFFGFIDSNGVCNRTAFRDVWEHGGLFLADELDKASPYVLSKLNAAFASAPGQCIEFPDGPIPRHKDCLIVGAGNTDMRGGTEKHHTSQAVDAATMTRFAFIEWGFDEAFEFTLVPEKHHDWVRKVHAYRRAVTETNNHGANINVSPRAIIGGATLRDGGVSMNDIENAVVWQHVNPDTVTTVKRAAKAFA